MQSWDNTRTSFLSFFFSSHSYGAQEWSAFKSKDAWIPQGSHVTVVRGPLTKPGWQYPCGCMGSAVPLGLSGSSIFSYQNFFSYHQSFFSLPEAGQDDRNGRFRHGFSAVSSVVAYCHLHSSNHQWLYMLIWPGRAELTLLRISHCSDLFNSALSYSNCSQPPPSTYCKTILP